MELPILRAHEGERLRIEPALIRLLVDEASGLERVLARREEALGASLERDLFPNGVPTQILPIDIRRALAQKLDSALKAWVASSPADRAGPSDDIVRPLRAIAESVRAGETHDETHDYLFPSGIPEKLSAAELLSAFRRAAAREQRSLVRLVSLVPAFEAWDTLIEHEIAGRAVLVVRLWVIAVRWYTLAAGRASTSMARSLQALLEKWTKLESQMRLVIEA
jgi:hypothetical protein